MIDNFGTTIAAAAIGAVLVAAAAWARGRSMRATAWLVSAALGANLLFVAFDAWSMGGTTNLTTDAEFGGLSKTVHHFVLLSILGWSTLLTAVALLGRRRGRGAPRRALDTGGEPSVHRR